MVADVCIDGAKCLSILKNGVKAQITWKSPLWTSLLHINYSKKKKNGDVENSSPTYNVFKLCYQQNKLYKIQSYENLTVFYNLSL